MSVTQGAQSGVEGRWTGCILNSPQQVKWRDSMALRSLVSRRDLYKAGLEFFDRSGVSGLFSESWRGMGAILMFHRIEEVPGEGFYPNRGLSVTPEFLAAVIDYLEGEGIEIVSLDEVHRRLVSRDESGGRFVAVTFDDGFVDNYSVAYPILKARGVPFTVFVATDLIDNDLDMWWVVVERAIAGGGRILVDIAGRDVETLGCGTPAEKAVAYERLASLLQTEVDEAEQRRFTRRLADRAGIDIEALCREEGMTWDQVRTLHADPLVTIGGHTAAHHALARLDEASMRADIERGLARLEEMLGERPTHFAYPYGSPAVAGPREFETLAAMGFKTAVTTRPGVLFPEHRDHLTALPRVSVNGEFQQVRYLGMLLAGWPFALFNRFRRLNVA